MLKEITIFVTKTGIYNTMSCILHIESATDCCSVAVSKDGILLFNKEDFVERNSSITLGKLLDQALEYIESRGYTLVAVSVSEGPGSYTGLRIGVSMAKGVCYARSLKLIGISTLKLLCVPFLLNTDLPDNALLCPMIDARRMEVYSAIYTKALEPVQSTVANIVNHETYRIFLDSGPVYFLGNGVEKCKSVLAHKNAIFVDNSKPLARWMYPLAEIAVQREDYQDLAYFEPYYLKDFIAKKPKELI